MPAWVRNSIRKQMVYLSNGSQDVASDLAGSTEAAAADELVSWVNVERIDSTMTLYAYLLQGARADQLATLATYTITKTGLTRLVWDEPLGAATHMKVTATASGSNVTGIFEVNDVFRSKG